MSSSADSWGGVGGAWPAASCVGPNGGVSSPAGFMAIVVMTKCGGRLVENRVKVLLRPSTGGWMWGTGELGGLSLSEWTQDPKSWNAYTTTSGGQNGLDLMRTKKDKRDMKFVTSF